jgi:hypothetical protein
MLSTWDGVVVFDYATWIAQYPEFTASVTQPQAQSYFNRLTIGGAIDNTPLSQVQDQFERTILLNLGVSHVAELAGALNPSRRELVGRISSATEGSVSVQTEYAVPNGPLGAWWNQTSYGAQYYASTLKYRTAFYAPPLRGAGLNGRGPFGSSVGLFGRGPFGRRF